MLPCASVAQVQASAGGGLAAVVEVDKLDGLGLVQLDVGPDAGGEVVGVVRGELHVGAERAGGQSDEEGLAEDGLLDGADPDGACFLHHEKELSVTASPTSPKLCQTL
jgi:hypothetical protein